MFKVTRVDHIGIAVKDLEAAKKFYEEVLGLKSAGDEVVEEQKVKVCFFPCGDSELELLESTSPDGPIAKHIERSGEGIQHVALRVDNIENALATLKEKKILGAAFDVFADEPLKADSKLFELENLVMTPHLGASTCEAQFRVGEMAVHQIKEFFLNNNMMNEVRAK